jgi:hypothetical protein
MRSEIVVGISAAGQDRHTAVFLKIGERLSTWFTDIAVET